MGNTYFKAKWNRCRERLRRAVLGGVILAAVGIGMTGCVEQVNGSVSGEDGKAWVVVEDAASVKPVEGIADKIMAVTGFKAIDWIDDKTLLAYQFSSTIFGEDRGLVALEVATGTIVKRYELAGTYFEGAMSPDRRSFLYSIISDRRGRGSNLFLLDLGTGDTKGFQADPYAMSNRVRWGQDLSAVQTIEVSRTQMALERLSATAVKRYDLKYPEALTKNNQFVYPEQFFEVPASPSSTGAFYGIVNTGQENLVAKVSLNEDETLMSETLELFSIQGALGLWASPKPVGESEVAATRLLVMTAEGSYTKRQLSLLDLEGKWLKTLLPNPVNIHQAVWISDSELLYTIYDTQIGTEVHWLNVDSGADSYVTTYTKGYIESLKPSATGNQILVSLAGDGPVVEGEPVSQIIVVK